MSLKLRVISEVRASLLLSIPLAGAQLAQAGVGFVDTVMMGWLGSESLAAGGLGAITFISLSFVGTGILAAVSPLAAEAFGSGNPQRVGQVVRQGFWVALGWGVPMTLLVWYGAPILRFLGQQPEIVAGTEVYLRAIAWGYIPALGFAVLRNFVSALSQPRSITVIMAASIPLNIAGNYTLMFGKLGFPALGLAGVGWSSTIVFWSMFLSLAVYVRTQPQFKRYGIFEGFPRLEWDRVREILRIGLPIGVMTFVETGLFAVTSFLMGTLGATSLAAHQIALETAGITFMVPLGISLATTVRVGQLMGQQDPKGARLAGFVGIGLGMLYMAVAGILLWRFPGAIVSLFLDGNDPRNTAVISLAKTLLGIAALFQIVDAIQVVATGALRGLKDTRIPLLIGIFSYWGMGMGGGYGLGIVLGLGAVGLWWGLALGLAGAAIVLTWRFWSKSCRIEKSLR
jgi:MATE family multidrug resistance protein